MASLTAMITVGGKRVMGTSGAIRSSDYFLLTPYGPTIGAEVSGIDLNALDDPNVVADLKRAFLDWKVLFFRDQDVTPHAHVELARIWGDPIIYPLPAKGALPEIVVVEHGPDSPGEENCWHSDVTFQETPALGSVLKAVQLPPLGGDTLWVDMEAAYVGLPESVKHRIADMMAVHDALAPHRGKPSYERAKRARDMFPLNEHPIVRVHPETGREILYVNPTYTTHIQGVSSDESDELLDLLFRQANHPEYQCRFTWTPGAVALWDNRATQHYAVSDYFPHRRRMERVTVAGDRPRALSASSA